MTVLHSINGHSAWILACEAAKQISHFAGAGNFWVFTSVPTSWQCCTSGKILPDRVVAMNAWQRGNVGRSSWAPAASLPAQTGLDWLLLHLGESSKSKQLTSPRKRPGSIIARLSLGPQKHALIQMKPSGLTECVSFAGVQSRWDKILMICRPFGRSGFRVMALLLSLLKKYYPKDRRVYKTCGILFFTRKSNRNKQRRQNIETLCAHF